MIYAFDEGRNPWKHHQSKALHMYKKCKPCIIYEVVNIRVSNVNIRYNKV